VNRHRKCQSEPTRRQNRRNRKIFPHRNLHHASLPWSRHGQHREAREPFVAGLLKEAVLHHLDSGLDETGQLAR
jgi:hypothetical protein